MELHEEREEGVGKKLPQLFSLLQLFEVPNTHSTAVSAVAKCFFCGGGRAILFSKVLSDFCSRGLNHLILYLKYLEEVSDQVKKCLDTKCAGLLYKIMNLKKLLRY